MSAAEQRRMLLVSKQLPGVTIYNADTHEPLGNARMEISPHEAAFSANGQHAYVPIYSNSGVGKPGTDGQLLHFVRTSNCRIIGSLDTKQYKRPHSIVVGQKSGLLYITAELAESVLIIDPHQQQIIGTVPTGSISSHMLAVQKDESKAYVSNVRTKTISVLDLLSRRLVKTIPTEGENQRMALSPDERWFVTNLGEVGQVAFYRTSDCQLDFTVHVKGVPFVSKFSADGKFLYTGGFSGTRRNAAWKIDIGQRKAVNNLTEGLGEDIGSLEVNPFTGNVYLSDQPTAKVHEIDFDTWQIVRTISTEPSPDAMAFVTVR